jgi:hypothetical protein
MATAGGARDSLSFLRHDIDPDSDYDSKPCDPLYPFDFDLDVDVDLGL